ncbi:MAG: PKD domain-containing protein, partial [Myxococcota bacterium]
MILLLAMSAHAGETPLLAAGADWRYLDTGVAPPIDWNTAGFDDSGWAVGPAPLGYGLVDIATTVSYGGDAVNRYVTTWFRATIDAADLPGALDDYEAFSLHLRRDDGAIVYLNGVEVMRSNLPTVVTDATLATLSVFGTDQDTFFPVVLPSDALVDGENVVAVELHQQSKSSTDLVMDLKLSAWDGPTAVTRGPYLQRQSRDGAVIRWQTDGPSGGRVTYGTVQGALDQTADQAEIGFDHEVALGGMPSDAEITYAIGTPQGVILEGDDAQHVFRTAPGPSSTRPIRIWALGDSGTANSDAEAVRDAYGAIAPDPLDTDVWLMLGDNAYGSGTLSEYDEAVFDFYPDWLRQVSLWPALGNHDAYSASSSTQSGPFFDVFTLPTGGEAGGVPSGTEAYYSFDYGAVHFVCLDSSDSDRSTTGAMASWVTADLEASADAAWTIVFFHHPPYSHGSHNSDFETELVEMRENFLPILEGAGVDLVLSGHSHDYERSYLLDGYYGDATEFDPVYLLQDHDGDPTGATGPYTKWPEAAEPHQGAVYIVAGSSGQMSGGGPLDHPAMYTSAAILGSLVIDIDGQRLETRFLDDAGAIYDTFAIDKGKTTIVAIDGPRIAMTTDVVTMTGLALQPPDGTEVPTYRWDWGDGSADTLGNPATHTWGAEGAYTVTLTVTDDAGVDTSKPITVNIDDGIPVIDQLSASPNAIEGAPVTLTGHGVDPGGDPLTYLWDVDGDLYEGDIVDVVFDEDGTFDVVLTVTDDAGRVVTGSLYVAVANAPPAIDDVTQTAAIEGAPVTVVALADDPGWTDWLTYAWTLPDGTIESGPVLVTTFADDGVWQVALVVSDDDGGITAQLVDVVIDNAAPVVIAPGFTGTLTEGSALTFDAGTFDPGALDTVTLSWEFDGDGTWVVGAPVEHVFGDQGPYEVWVAAEDDDGGLGLAPVVVTLANVPAAIRAIDVPAVVGEGLDVPVAVAVDDPGFDDAIDVRWTWGDGNVGSGAATSHAFPSEGTFAGSVEVADDEGEGESAGFVVTVVNADPQFRSVPPDQIAPGATYAYDPAVFDLDPVTFALEGPPGATL